MAYELHIQRPGWDFEDAATYLDIEQVREAVAPLEGCRLTEGYETVAQNPQTGETIRIGPRPAVIEVLLPGERRWFRKAPDAWYPVFHFGSGSLSSKPAFDLNDPEDTVRKVAAHLARELDCEITGDDGESYDWS